jgi:hypothetical protein
LLPRTSQFRAKPEFRNSEKLIESSKNYPSNYFRTVLIYHKLNIQNKVESFSLGASLMKIKPLCVEGRRAHGIRPKEGPKMCVACVACVAPWCASLHFLVFLVPAQPRSQAAVWVRVVNNTPWITLLTLSIIDVNQ